MKTARFNYYLPSTLIAQSPKKPRDHSRLMILNRQTGQIYHDHFFNLGRYLKKGDVLVLNDSKVFPARLIGRKKTGGQAEILLIQKETKNSWQCLVKTKKARENLEIEFKKNSSILKACLKHRIENGRWLVNFDQSGEKFDQLILKLGQAPTPPYIKKISSLKEYQTIYARKNGSIAAPTAGFHFTSQLIRKLKKQGIQFEFITLHVGLGTFLPIKSDQIEKHQMLAEQYTIQPDVFKRLQKAKKSGTRIISVGTTSTRTLESIFGQGKLKKFNGWTNLFIKPGYRFKFIDGLITNFHVPESTNLVLVSVLAGQKMIKLAYQSAVKRKYRFYSFGDAMLII